MNAMQERPGFRSMCRRETTGEVSASGAVLSRHHQRNFRVAFAVNRTNARPLARESVRYAGPTAPLDIGHRSPLTRSQRARALPEIDEEYRGPPRRWRRRGSRKEEKLRRGRGHHQRHRPVPQRWWRCKYDAGTGVTRPGWGG